MPINFDKERFCKISEDYSLWWEGKLNRTLLFAKVCKGNKINSKIPLLSQVGCNDFRITPEQIIERLDLELSNYDYLADAYPFVSLDPFGPGIVVAFLGANHLLLPNVILAI